MGGGLLSRRPCTLSSDGTLLLCPCGRLVHIYSAVTGERVGALVGHDADVTAVVLNPEDEHQVYSCSLDATVRLWDLSTGAQLHTLTTREPVMHMVVHKQLGVAYLSVQLREGGGRVMLYNLRTGQFSGTAMKTRSAGPLALSPAGGFCATLDRHSLFVWRAGTDIYQPLNLHHTKPYACLAIAADDSAIAAGDASGRLLVWRAFDAAVPSALRGERGSAHAGKHHPAPSEAPPLTTLHWHASGVGCVAFAPDGAHLLSGGAEGVLVLWSMDTGRPNFLPRLGGPLVGLHPSPADPAKYVVRQADNVVRLVNVATMKVEASVMGLRPPPSGLLPPAGVAGGAAAVLAAGAGGAAAAGGAAGGYGTLVVPCENAQLQLYDVARDRHVRLVQVAPRNAVSLVEQQQHPQAGPHAFAEAPPPPPPFVSLLAFSADGTVLATVDVRPDAGPYGSTEACLKFWDAGGAAVAARDAADASTSAPSPSGPFVLNTRVDEPHRELVTALAYHPRRHMAVTAGGPGGADAEFKVWVREERRHGGGRPSGGGGGGGGVSTHWRCRSVGGYKGLPLGALSYSADGSVLAVAAAARVTLWDADGGALAAVLPAAAAAAGPASAPPLTALAFVPGTPYLAAASPACLAVYNLLTAAVHWTLPCNVVSLSADAVHGLLAVAVRAPEPQAAAPPAAAAAAAAPADAPADADADAADAGGAAVAGGAAAAAAGAGGAAAGAVAGAAPARTAAPPLPSCHVLVVDPRDGTPRFHCHVPGAANVCVMHLAAASGRGGGGGGCSPLLVLRDNRQYVLAAPPGVHLDGTDEAEGAAGAPLAALAPPTSALEATFGRPAPEPMDVDGGAGGAGAGGSGHVGGRPKWAELFDAPSHALPPPAALASAFLSLLTTADG